MENVHTKSLSDRIVRFMRNNPGTFICSGDIQIIAAKAGYEASNAARRLRELTNEGILEVEYRKGSNGPDVSWYRYKPQEKIITHYEKVSTEAGEVVQAVQRTIFD